MIGPRTDQDVERSLSAWMDAVAPNRPPVRILEETFARTMREPQDGARPWNRIDAGRAARRGWRAGPAVAFAIVVILVAAAMIVALSAGGSPQVAPPTPKPSVLAVAGASSPTASPTPTPRPPAIPVTPDAIIEVDGIQVDGVMGLAAGGGSLWILVPGLVHKVDTDGNTITGSATLDGATDEYQGIAASDAGVWATNYTTTSLLRVDPATLTVIARTKAGVAPKGVLATADDVWVADLHGGAVLRVDPATDDVTATVTVGPTGSSGPNWLGSGLGSIWVDIPNNGTVVRVSPVTETVQATIAIPSDLTACGGFAIDTDAAWVTSCAAAWDVIRIDPATNLVVSSTDVGGYASVTLINGDPWVSVDPGAADTGFLARIDPATNAIDRVLAPGTSFGGGGDMVVADGSVWALDGYHGTLLRLPMSAFAP